MVTFILTNFTTVVLVLTILAALRVNNKTFVEVEIGSKSQIVVALALGILIFYAFGSRSLGYDYGDTGNYVHVYTQISKGLIDGQSEEPLWRALMFACMPYTDAGGFIMIVSCIYVLCTTLASIKLFPNNALLALLFNVGSFSFFTYGVNGIRNGLACSIVLLGITLMCGKRIEKLVGIGLGLLAIGFHKSTILPVGVAIVALWFIKDFTVCFKFWVFSIFLSLLFGTSIGDFFANLGFDDRLSYITATGDADKFSRTGFRWDFLIYSAMPIWLGYYVIIKRGFRNKIYEFLLNTYILSNAFWIMVIRAEFSNRFAYLSWFIYPLILAYPCLKMDIWGDEQGKRLAQIMMAQVGFTWFMNVLI